jgi:uncharacterized membrane protein (GlpM family)
LTELLARFVIGGTMVAAFSFIGCLFSPKSFAGLFGAAPSIALATLLLTVSKDGAHFGATEAHSMMAGAIAFFFYASIVSLVLMTKKVSALVTTSAGIIVWFGACAVLWLVWIRHLA